jgi:transcriptional regulator with XRE-family HTH domain
MIRLTDLGKIGPALFEIREMLGISRREAARRIAEITGRTETSVNAQIWEWDRDKRRPDLKSMRFLLDVLDMDLALVEKQGPVRTWPRLLDPPADVTQVRTENGTVFTRMDRGGHYWSAKGWGNGVSWAQVLRWGPVEEVKDEEAAGDHLGPDQGGGDTAGRDLEAQAAGG